MSKNLIIVESPNKIQTIKSYLDDSYDVIASFGHLREMNSKVGYDKKTYWPNWTIIKGKGNTSKQSIVKKINDLAKKADNIFLATDPDREGEAISWHIYDLLSENDKKKCCRITFNEITQKAISAAIDNKHNLDMNLVYSQFARRIIDRIIGYKLSSFVRQTVYGKSAGRVQSVALKFIVSRELERQAFIPSKWYEIDAILDNGLKLTYTAKNKNYEKYQESESTRYKFKFANLADVEKVQKELSNNFKFINYDKERETIGDAYAPITTDKMLQIAASSLGWSASKTTSIAQKLFEGVEIDNKHIGLITYPRTDSERINDDFIEQAKSFLSSKYSNELVNFEYSSSIKVKKSKNNDDSLKNIQDAHEAIRPVDPTLMPENIKNFVDDSLYRLYNIIWSRTMSVLMKRPIYLNKGMFFDNNTHEFYFGYKEIKFLGYLALDFYSKVVQQYNNEIPKLIVGNLYLGKIEISAYDKQPPPYFTEGTLISALKESGVGRPSTYAMMAKISETRGYVNKENQKLIPTDMGMKVIDKLNKDFPEVVDSNFTANMENELDKIATGNEIWTNYLDNFAPKFEAKVSEIFTKHKEDKIKNTNKIDRKCPKCESDLIERESRFGSKFIACSAFPKCKYAEFDNSNNLLDEECPECGGKLIKRFNKKGQQFIGCSSYPNCKYIKKNN